MTPRHAARLCARCAVLLLAGAPACGGGEADPGRTDARADAGASSGAQDAPAGDGVEAGSDILGGASDGSAADGGSDVARDTRSDGDPEGSGDADEGSGDTDLELSADAAADVSADPLDWAVAEPGPFHVGYRAIEVTYATPDGTGDRTITLNLWYPTEATDGAPALYLGAFRDAASFAGAPLAPAPWAGGTYPVHLHSHGFQGFGGTSAFLMRHFASHGWVAIAPDHRGNTLLDFVAPLDTAHYINKVADLKVALDTLEALPGSDPLSGRARTDRVVASGHSFGVYAMWAISGAVFDMDVVTPRCDGGDIPAGSCSEMERALFADGLGDPRVVATIGLAGAYQQSWFGSAGYLGVDAPFLSMTGSNDPVGGPEQLDTAGGHVRLWWHELEGGCHQTFALGACETLATATGWRAVDAAALAFARHWILGDGSPGTRSAYDGSAPVDPVVTVQVSAAARE